jgi:hypothetical protein
MMTTRCTMLPLVTTLIVMVVAFSLRTLTGHTLYLLIHGVQYRAYRSESGNNTVCHPYNFAPLSKGTSFSYKLELFYN